MSSILKERLKAMNADVEDVLETGESIPSTPITSTISSTSSTSSTNDDDLPPALQHLKKNDKPSTLASRLAAMQREQPALDKSYPGPSRPANENEIELGTARLTLAQRIELMQEQKESKALASSTINFQVVDKHSAKEIADRLRAGNADLQIKDRYGNLINLSDLQLCAVDFATAGKCFVLTGEAGSGKTTTFQAIVRALLMYHEHLIKACTYRATDYSGELVEGISIACVAPTRRAANNVNKALAHDPLIAEKMAPSVMTIHNLLEFAPVWSEIIDEETGDEKTVMRYEPRRNEMNPLDVTHIAIDESSMVPESPLYQQLLAALRPGTQIILIGDINQIQPVGGRSVLSYALKEWPIVHLNQIYRQALDNPIIAAAHSILKGGTFEAKPPHLRWIKGKKKSHIPATHMAKAMQHLFSTALDSSPEAVIEYDPAEDIILCPHNIGDLGNNLLNKIIAQKLGEQRNAIVYHIVTGFDEHYLAVGDKVMVNKVEGIITKINVNAGYFGKRANEPSEHMNRWGHYTSKEHEAELDRLLDEDSAANDEFDYSNFDVSKMLDDDEDVKHAASHVVYVELEDGREAILNSAGQFNKQTFQLGYALSIHKSQGSEWRRVFIVLHKIHKAMLSRELLYTAVTRAREELVLIAKDDLVIHAAKNPRFKGDTLAEKIEFFTATDAAQDKQVSLLPTE